MGDYDDVDLDRATMRAWSRFRGELADHIVAMGDGDVLVVDAEACVDEESPGATPYVQFCAWGDDLVRAEVASNEYLAAEVMLDEAGEAALVEVGWTAPTYGGDERPDSGSANFYVDAGRRQGDRLAAMAVAALRDVFGVPHPAFLDWPPAEDVDGSEPAESTGDGDRPDEPLAVMPESAEHLRELVGAALTPPGGPAVEYDDDGDIPLATGSALLYVRVSDAAPVVELFGFVVRGIEEAERASFEVAVLNRDTHMVKFVLLDDAVLATAHLPAMPFAPRQLRALVSAMADVVDRVDDDLLARLGGRRGTEPQPETDEDTDAPEEGESAGARTPHPALQTLLHLDPHGEGDVDPELAASVCDFDRDLVLTLLSEAREQETSRRRSGAAAMVTDDSGEAEGCCHEGLAWQATVETLRPALRVIVERRRAEATGRTRVERSPGSAVSRGRRRERDGMPDSLVDDATIRRDTTGHDLLFEPDRRTDEGRGPS